MQIQVSVLYNILSIIKQTKLLTVCEDRGDCCCWRLL